jgi:arginase
VTTTTGAWPGSAPWEGALPDALPGLVALRDVHADMMSRDRVPVLAASRCAATLPNVATLRPDAVVVWFDAHADLNTPAGSTTGYLGGLVLSAAVGWWDSGLGSGLAPERIVLGGARDLDPPEQALVDAGTVRLAAGPHLMDQLDRYVGDSPVYFHLDCDVLEPGTVPTDYRVPGGLGLDDHADYARPLVDALAPLWARWAREVPTPDDTAL